MSISTELESLSTNVSQIETDLKNINSSLTKKNVSVPEGSKLSGVPALIDSIKSGSTVELVITAPEYEGETLTATKGSKKVTGKVSSGVARIPVDEEGTWKVSATDGNSIEIVSDMTFEGELSKTRTYGIKITESESDPARRVTYIDDAIGMSPVTVSSSSGQATYNNWDKTWIFKKIYPVMLKTDGTIDYKLNANDYAKRESGEASAVADSTYNGNAMVCVEKFYTKFSMNGEDEVIEVCDTKKEGFEAIGFIRSDGSEADKIFLPMFMGSFDSSSKLRSLSGQTIKYSTSFTDFRTAAQKNGSNYDIETWAMNQILQALFFILMKSCNPKTAIGAGRNYNDGSSKTGLMNTKGAIACDPSTKAVKFMHVEDFTSSYSNGMYRFEAGALSQNSKLYIKMKPPYSGTSTSGYAQVSDYVHGTNYISKMKCNNSYGRYPIVYSGSDSTYDVAYWYGNSSSNCYISQRGRSYGVAGRNIRYSASYSYDNFGAALSLLPPA